MANLGEALARLFPLKDTRPTREWAPENVELFPPITKLGMFRTAESRHFEAPFDSLDDGRVREVNILKPVRGGGSLIADVHLIEVMSRRPGPALNVFQTDSDAKTHFADRLHKMLLGNPCTAKLLPAKYEWSDIHLLNGYGIYTGGPALANLQSKTIRWLREDECWIFPEGRMAEAEARIGDYLKLELSKVLRISQGGPAPLRTINGDAWHRAFHRGAIHEWEVQCPHCQIFYEPVFSGQKEDGSYWGITWDRIQLPNGDWDLAKCPATVRFECPGCHVPVVDSERAKSEWNRTGRYRLATAADAQHHSYHWETVIDFPWDKLVYDWLDACNEERRGNLGPKLQFYQKRRAQFKDEESLLKGSLNLSKSVYEVTSKLDGEMGRGLAIDRQEEDMFWVEARAWLSNGDCLQLWFGKVYGFAALEEKRKEFEIDPRHVFIDSAYHPKGDHGVYEACIRYGWIAVRGDKEPYFIHALKGGKRVLKSYAPVAYADPESGTSQQGRKKCPLIRFSKDQMNQVVDRLISSGHWKQPMTPPDPKMAEEYSAQMAQRVRMTEYNAKTNESKVYYREGRNDHGRDLANHCVLYGQLREFIADPCAEKISQSDEKPVLS